MLIPAMIGLCAEPCLSQNHAASKMILCLGDSITAGGTSYRQVLVPELRKQGYAFEFIGPNKDDTSAHAGYGGKNTAYLLSISKELYAQYPADIVLIHSGHNSFSKDKPVPGIVRDTEAIIHIITEQNPKATILLAQAIPAGKLPKYAYIPDLNLELEGLATRLKKQGVNLILVNQADGFDWQTDTIADHVHPNAAGADKMAAKWMEALLPLLEKKQSGECSIPSSAVPTMHQVPLSERPPPPGTQEHSCNSSAPAGLPPD